MRLIDADLLYERACSLEAQALDYVGKLIERDGDEVSVEWKIWSAILTERTAFKHDVFDAPTIEERKKGKWIKYVSPINEDDGQDAWDCSECAAMVGRPTNYCPRCGARMER